MKKINRFLLDRSTAPSIQNREDQVSYLSIAKVSGEEFTLENYKASPPNQST